MFVNNILSNWEWDIISKLKYVLCQLHFTQILAGEGEKKQYFPVFNKLEVIVWIYSLERVDRWIILDSNIILIEIS